MRVSVAGFGEDLCTDTLIYLFFFLSFYLWKVIELDRQIEAHLYFNNLGRQLLHHDFLQTII